MSEESSRRFSLGRPFLLLLGVFLGLIPHGVFEIPALALAGTGGIVWYRSVREAEEPAKGFKEGMKSALKLFMASVLLLLVAAFVEAYITPRVAGLG